MNSTRCLLFILVLLCACPLSAQRVVLGGSLSGGTSLESGDPIVPTVFDGRLVAGQGYTIGGLLGYELGDWLFALRPAFQRQDLRAIIPPRDEVPGGVESRIYQNTLLLSLRADHFFGRQRFRPAIGVGAGFLLDLSNDVGMSSLRPEPVLPYVEISAGVEGRFAGLRWRPEVTLYHGVGEIFAASRGIHNPFLQGRRWAFASFGLVLMK